MATFNIFLHCEKPIGMDRPTVGKHYPIAVEEVNEPGLPQGIQRYSYEKLFFYGFSGVVKNDAHVVLAHMLLPKYFEEVSGYKHDLHGLFIVGFQDNPDPARKIVEIMLDLKKQGGNGCPWLLHMPGVEHNRFTFNDMSFHPFLMIDLTIGYFVCDQDGRFDWDETNTLEMLAVDEPIVYDATLGLYTTRKATRFDPDEDPAYVQRRNRELDKVYAALKESWTKGK